MDKKIQDAANSHEPPFREDDWDRMHALLEKHLPQERKKRPFLLSLLFLLLVGFPATVMLTTYKNSPAFSSVTQKTDNRTSTTTQTGQEKVSSTGVNPDNPGYAVIPEPSTLPPENEKAISAGPSFQAEGNRVPVIGPGPSLKRHDVRKQQKQTTIKPGIQKDGTATGDQPSLSSTVKHDQTAATETTVPPPVETSVSMTDVDSVKPSVTQTTDSLPAEELLSKKEKKTGKPENGKWQISFSAGPDLSMVGIEKTGKWRMQYGLGISYALNARLQVRTGFMVGRKLYYADSSDYHPPKGFWNYYTNLQKIDANCLVYEIPLNVVYNFPSGKKHQWFVSTGLSSYLMKKETYEYYYKDSWGVPMYRERTIQNENDHFFSILQLSGGYLYKFSDRLTMMAEPYAKLPLGGVGFGKVKLNNTGVLFTVGYKPFVRNK